MEKSDALPESETQIEPEAPVAVGPKYFPGFFASIGWIILYFVLQGVCTAILVALGSKGASLSGAVSVLSYPVLVLWGLVLSATIQLLLMWRYLRKDGRIERLGLNGFGRLSFIKATGLAIVLVIAAMLFNSLYATYLIPGIGMQDGMTKMLSSIPRTPINMAALFVAIAVAAPVVEELLFRGFLQNSLTRFVPVWAAILLSSLGFALVHMQPYAIPGLMSLSIAFGYLYHRTGSLRTNILLHMANNSFALLLTQVIS